MHDVEEIPSEKKPAGPPPSPKPAVPYYVVSLHDAFRAFVAVRNKSMPMHPGRSTFWQRTVARLKNNESSILTVLDIGDDAGNTLAYRGKVEAEDRARFVHELRFGMLPAIGYLLPRAEGARPRLIPKEVWENPQFDWARAEVSGAGWAFAHVQIVMNDNFPEAKGTDVYGEALPELAPFLPSEDERAAWHIPAGLPDKVSSDAVPKQQGSDTQGAAVVPAKMGRPSFKADIRRAYDELKPHDCMTDKALFHEIRQRVMHLQGLPNDKGLGDAAIKKHVIAFRKAEHVEKK